MTDLAAIDNRPPIVVLRDRLEARSGELRAALGDIPVEQFVRAVITSATINPDIQACSWSSVWLACMRACRDGLLPDGVQGAIVPFKGNAQWIPMYQGLVARFRRSGNFKWIGAAVVRDGEEWTHYTDETGEHFRHVPGDDINRPIQRIYAAATTLDGGMFVAVLPKGEADKIKNMSRTTRDDAPWKMWESEMYKKTALRRLAKLLPSARDILPEDELEATSEPTHFTREANRQIGATAALDAFVGRKLPEAATAASQASSAAADLGEEGGAQGAPAADDSAVSAARKSPADETDPAATDPLTIAWRRGHGARLAGAQRKAVPGEYRDKSRMKEMDAWLAGFDDKPLPEKGMI